MVEISGVESAITAVGGQQSLADLIGCTQQNVSAWRVQGWVPVEHIVAVEQHTGVARLRLIKPQLMELLAPPSV